MPTLENPAYSITSSLVLPNNSGPKPRYLTMLLDLFGTMRSTHESSATETFYYDKETREGIGNIEGGEFSIVINLPENNLRLTLGGLKATKMVPRPLFDVEFHREVDLGTLDVQRCVQQGLVKELDIFTPEVILKLNFHGFSGEQSAAFLRYMTEAFASQNLPRIREFLAS